MGGISQRPTDVALWIQIPQLRARPRTRDVAPVKRLEQPHALTAACSMPGTPGFRSIDGMSEEELAYMEGLSAQREAMTGRGGSPDGMRELRRSRDLSRRDTTRLVSPSNQFPAVGDEIEPLVSPRFREVESQDEMENRARMLNWSEERDATMRITREVVEQQVRIYCEGKRAPPAPRWPHAPVGRTAKLRRMVAECSNLGPPLDPNMRGIPAFVACPSVVQLRNYMEAKRVKLPGILLEIGRRGKTGRRYYG